MNRFEKALEHIKKNVEIQDDWTEEDMQHYETIKLALEFASYLYDVEFVIGAKGGAE